MSVIDLGPSHDLTATDALRSLKRYVADVLGAWEVRLTFEEGGFERPFAMVTRAGPTLYTAAAPLVDVLCPFVIQAYPVVGSSMDESLMNAEDAHELLFQAFGRGVDLGRQARIPFFDYKGVPLNQANGTQVAHRYMRVQDLNVEIAGEPDDYALFIVHCDVRVSWRRAGWIDPDPGPPATGSSVAINTP